MPRRRSRSKKAGQAFGSSPPVGGPPQPAPSAPPPPPPPPPPAQGNSGWGDWFKSKPTDPNAPKKTWGSYVGLGGRRRSVKGSRSKSRRGRLNYTTKRSSTMFNRRGHRQRRSSRGVKRRPFSKGGRRSSRRRQKGGQ